MMQQTKIGKLSKDWKVINLDEIIQSDRGITYGIVQPGPFDPNGRFLVRGKDYSRGWVNPSEFFRVTPTVEEPYKRARLKANDLITTIVGAGLGNMEIVPEWLEGANITQTTARLAIDETKADFRFYYHVLNSNIGKQNVRLFEKGGAQPGLNLGDIKKYTVPLPPLPEQQKIAEILSTVDAKIEVIDQQITETQALKKGLMQRLLTKGIGHTKFKDSALGEIPKSWEVVKLEEACLPKEGMRRGPFGGAIKKEFFVNNGYQVYEQRNAIYDNFTTARYFINEDKYEELKAFKVEANDFIVSCSGTIGKIAKVPNNFKEGVINQALLRLRLKSNIIEDDFFLQQFRFEPFQNKITDSTQGGAMKNLVGMSEFKKSLIVLPPIKEQKTIAQILTLVDNKEKILSDKKIHYQELKKGLTQQLLTGKIRVKLN